MRARLATTRVNKQGAVIRWSHISHRNDLLVSGFDSLNIFTPQFLQNALRSDDLLKTR